MDFTEEELERYSRHLILKEIGFEGQEKIKKSSVLIIGAGGLGAPVGLYLAASGVGTIGIADYDKVELSNLQRQVIHFTSDIGINKTESAKVKMEAINPHVNVVVHNTKVDSTNIRKIIRGYDFVIDATDSFGSKFLINDACIFENKPYSHGGILKFEGQTLTVIPGVTACYRCLFRYPPPIGAVPTCSQAGILGAVAGMLGTIQAAEAVKFITGKGVLIANRLLSFDALTMEFRSTTVFKDDLCPVCSPNSEITELKDAQDPACSITLKKDK